MKTITTKPQPGEPARRRAPSGPPDLHSQLEGLLDAVWDSEANWRLDDRIDLATRSRRRTR